jgi:hypothetical protein
MTATVTYLNYFYLEKEGVFFLAHKPLATTQIFQPIHTPLVSSGISLTIIG